MIHSVCSHYPRVLKCNRPDSHLPPYTFWVYEAYTLYFLILKIKRFKWAYGNPTMLFPGDTLMETDSFVLQVIFPFSKKKKKSHYRIDFIFPSEGTQKDKVTHVIAEKLFSDIWVMCPAPTCCLLWAGHREVPGTYRTVAFSPKELPQESMWWQGPVRN